MDPWISEQSEVRRTWVPARLTGALGRSLARWEDLFDLLEGHPSLWEPLRSSTLLAKKEGRPRKSGEWALAYLAYANTGERELRRWHQLAPKELWERAGFDAVPSYHSAYENFNALEAHECVFRQVAAALVQLAVKQSGGKVGHAVHVDGTEAETNSRLVHDCSGHELATCTKQLRLPKRVQPADAREERHQIAIEQPTDDALLGGADELAADERGLRIRVGKCWFRLSDGEAGIRAYTTASGKLRRFWSGYYNIKAVDHYTGGVLAAHVVSASTQEHCAYPTLYEQVKEHIGTTPRAVVADRGFSVSAVFEAHTRDGVASVIPWRKGNASEGKRVDYLPRYDRHGIPHCKHCGMEGIFHRFQHDSGPNKEPRLWFRCSKPGGPECQAVQSMLCKENWRLLLPLWRTSPAYQVLRQSHENYENAHHRWRERYGCAGDTKADRPKRRGLGVQQLRASAALVIEWLTICHRQGWLGGPVLNERTESVLSTDEAANHCALLRSARAALGLSACEPAGMEAHQAAVANSYTASSAGSAQAAATIAAQAGNAKPPD